MKVKKNGITKEIEENLVKDYIDAGWKKASEEKEAVTVIETVEENKEEKKKKK